MKKSHYTFFAHILPATLMVLVMAFAMVMLNKQVS